MAGSVSVGSVKVVIGVGVGKVAEVKPGLVKFAVSAWGNVSAFAKSVFRACSHYRIAR